MCLAQGLQRIEAGKAQTRGPPLSRVKHSTTEPLGSRYTGSYSAILSLL